MDTVANGRLFPSIREFFQMLITFSLTVIAWVFFRSPNLNQAFLFLKRMIAGIGDWKIIRAKWLFLSSPGPAFPFLFAAFILIEWIGRNKDYGLAAIGIKWARPARFAFYYSILLIILLTLGRNQQFIYFQF